MTPPVPPLKLGVLTDGEAIPEWLAASLREVTRHGIARVALVIERDASGDEPPPPRGRLQKWWRNRSQLGFALAGRLDRNRAQLPPSASLRSLAPDARWLKVTPVTGRFTDSFAVFAG